MHTRSQIQIAKYLIQVGNKSQDRCGLGAFSGLIQALNVTCFGFTVYGRKYSPCR